MRPLIGITVDNKDNTAASGTYECAARYSRAVAEAGGLPVLLPHEVERVGEYVARLDGFVLTGGVDPDTRPFGQPLHAAARLMDPGRQAFELALLRHCRDARPGAPVLGVCLGMQLMALDAGGTLDQHMPDTLGIDAAAAHYQNRRHGIRLLVADGPLGGAEGAVVSHHRQAVAQAGRLRVVARAADDTIEAVDDPGRPFYVGVQWHPERNDDPAAAPVNQRLFARLVDAARSAR